MTSFLFYLIFALSSTFFPQKFPPNPSFDIIFLQNDWQCQQMSVIWSFVASLQNFMKHIFKTCLYKPVLFFIMSPQIIGWLCQILPVCLPYYFKCTKTVINGLARKKVVIIKSVSCQNQTIHNCSLSIYPQIVFPMVERQNGGCTFFIQNLLWYYLWDEQSMYTLSLFENDRDVSTYSRRRCLLTRK